MANKIREVLEIESEDSYIKRPAIPMITVETRDIGKLVKHICIPSMVEGATTKDITLQRILYSGLPNQCRKCHQFGHFAQNLHSDQNPNLEQKCSHRHSPNVEWKGSTWPYRYIRHPIHHPLP
jgi:hypothetical protein